MRAQAIVVAVLGATAVALGACSGPGPIPPPPPSPASQVATIRLSADSMVSDSLPLTAGGDTAHITATALDASGNPVTGVTFVWSSSDTAIVTVSSGGLVTATGPGAAQINVTVANASADRVAAHTGGVEYAVDKGYAASKVLIFCVPQIRITPTSATIGVGQSAGFTVTAVDWRGVQEWGPVQATWTSSSPSIANIQQAGPSASTSALGNSNGTTLIKATVNLTTKHGIGPYYGKATLVVAPCGGALNATSWTIDSLSITYTANGTVGPETFAITESGRITGGILALNAVSVTNPVDSVEWFGGVTGTMSDANSVTVPTGLGPATATESATNAPFTGQPASTNMKLILLPVQSGACQYTIEFAGRYQYTSTDVNGVVTKPIHGNAFVVEDTIAATGNGLTLAGSRSVPATGLLSSLGTPFYEPGTNLGEGAADALQTTATIAWQIHGNTK